ncbi:MAG: chloride channel protein, partial [Thermoplasmatota archaeon]
LTRLVYFFEDAFLKLPFHWAWWPAIGGLAIGIGGLVEPRALGVGYDTIGLLVAGEIVGVAVVALVVTKALIWSISLGSGTSGGVLAPLLMMGAALGALSARAMPYGDASAWALIGMGAMMAGTMRVPFTGIVFTMELTHDWNLLLPLLAASIAAYAFTVLALRRSILTEKVARRGHHVMREYVVDPLESLRVGEVMTRDVEALPASMLVVDAIAFLHAPPAPGAPRHHQGYPVLDTHRDVVGVVTRGDALAWQVAGFAPDATLDEVIVRAPVRVFADELASRAADAMARERVGRVLVVDRDRRKLVGIVSRADLIDGRLRRLLEETNRERVLHTGVSVLMQRMTRPRAPPPRAPRPNDAAP